MLDQITIRIINTADGLEEEEQVRYHSPSMNYMRQAFSIERLSPSVPATLFFKDDTPEADPIEISEITSLKSYTDDGVYPLTVTIDPGYSFGDGRHATTWLCVKYLVEHLAGVPGVKRSGLSLLDAGTGTGVLSITAARLGIRDIDAIDIYHHAVQCAKNNCSLNNCEWIRLHESDLSAFNPGKTYDIVMANLVSDVIIANLEWLINHTTPGGVIIASGVSAGKSETVQRHFMQSGLDLVDCTGRDGWFGFLLRRPSTAGSNQ
jgi:ribosomal protein L11 methylase PrmA